MNIKVATVETVTAKKSKGKLNGSGTIAKNKNNAINVYDDKKSVNNGKQPATINLTTESNTKDKSSIDAQTNQILDIVKKVTSHTTPLAPHVVVVNNTPPISTTHSNNESTNELFTKTLERILAYTEKDRERDDKYKDREYDRLDKERDRDDKYKDREYDRREKERDRDDKYKDRDYDRHDRDKLNDHELKLLCEVSISYFKFQNTIYK